MCAVTSSTLILLLGSLLTSANDIVADSKTMNDLSPRLLSQYAVLQQEDATAYPTNGQVRGDYMLSDDHRLERLFGSDSSSADSSQPDTQNTVVNLLQRIQQLVRREQKGLSWNRKSHVPLVGRTVSAPLFVGKKSAPTYVGKVAAPAFVDKRFERPLQVTGNILELWLKSLLGAFNHHEAPTQYRQIAQTEKHFEAPFFVGRKRSQM